jgi:hypothetical protein
MSTNSLKKLQNEKAKLLAQLSSLSNLLHGSWVERYSVCSRPDCECHKGKRHGPRRYLVINVEGRQRQKYIANSQVALALEGIAQYRRLQKIVDRITQLNLTLMKEDIK